MELIQQDKIAGFNKIKMGVFFNTAYLRFCSTLINAHKCHATL